MAAHGFERLSERRLSDDELEATDITDGSGSADHHEGKEPFSTRAPHRVSSVA
jgi:hypothetical protein